MTLHLDNLTRWNGPSTITLDLEPQAPLSSLLDAVTSRLVRPEFLGVLPSLRIEWQGQALGDGPIGETLGYHNGRKTFQLAVREEPKVIDGQTGRGLEVMAALREIFEGVISESFLFDTVASHPNLDLEGLIDILSNRDLPSES